MWAILQVDTITGEKVPRKPISKTIAEHPDAVPGAAEALAGATARARGGAVLAPAARRERIVREITADARRDPLRALAEIIATTADPALRVQAARALAPFVYPALRAVEVSGPDGERLVVEVRRA
jgi:hypothetical protein